MSERSSWAGTCSAEAQARGPTSPGEKLVRQGSSFPHAGLRAYPVPTRATGIAGRTTFTFVSEGIDAALEFARSAANESDVVVSGGAGTAKQYLAAGLIDESRFISWLCSSVLAFGCLTTRHCRQSNSSLRTVEAPGVTHLKYRVVH